MILPDVNVLVHALRSDARDHLRYARWLADLVEGTEETAGHDLALSGVVRVATHPRIMARPTAPAVAADFARFPGLRFFDPARE